MTTPVEQYELVAQLGLLEGIKAGAFVDSGQAAAITALTTITTVDAIDPATTMALVNEVKAKVNAIIAALKA
ncbi:head fiber protein [Pseudomonas phage UNO-G1W1]|jgi:hypothetical protein|uniref:Head fiber protein n=1 Tax=Pseudomonas phage UNO-G1W1 TaxID=3136609 RepID=A0AAX4MVU1_9CAUD